MNNAQIITEEEEVDVKPLLRERVSQLTELIEALNNIAGSSYWKVLKQLVFDVDLAKAKRKLYEASDTTEIFRLQGEIRWGKKFNLEKLIVDKRNELEAIRNKL